MRECNGNTCRVYKYTKAGMGKRFYCQGVKYCKTCNEYLKIDSIRCPCCKSQMRLKSHQYQSRIAVSVQTKPSILLITSGA